MIDYFFRRLVPRIDEHLSDDQLASFLCDELTLKGRLKVRQHLKNCWHCRLRREDIEGRRVDEIIEFYRNEINSGDPTLSAEPRAEFARKLEAHLIHLSSAKDLHVVPETQFHQFFGLKTAFALCLVVLVGTGVSYLAWRQKQIPNITSDVFLLRAEKWDWPSLEGGTGVVYQSVRITGPKVTMARSIYRGLQGKRFPEKVKLVGEEETLKNELVRAGVNWDEPISASDYQKWRSQQHKGSDEITRAGTHLLKLTTTAPDSSISAQSLTVRDTDFHPIVRTIALRNIGMVEIAELDFKILPIASFSEEVSGAPASPFSFAVDAKNRIPETPKFLQLVTQEQLDEAELSTRLVLNQLHADNGEQIELRREQQVIVVEGVVETDERKHELQRQLNLISHVKSAIQSVNDLKDAPVAIPVTIQMASMPDEPSPLEQFEKKRGRSLAESNTFAQQLSSAVLAISRESKAIFDLKTHFAAKGRRDILAEATLTDLVYSHRERLNVALKSEQALLAETQIRSSEPGRAFQLDVLPMPDEANRNLALLKELTESRRLVTRNAEDIFADMTISLARLTVASNGLLEKPQQTSSLEKKK